jgi:hypothetical protein
MFVVVITRVSQRIMEEKGTTDSSMLQKQMAMWIRKEKQGGRFLP